MMPPSQPGETIRNGSKERLFARSVLLLGAAGALTVCFLTAFGGQGTVVPPARRLLFAGGSLLLATALLAALRLPQNARTGLAVTLLSLITAAYFAELYLRWETTQDLWSVARRLGLPYDDRQRVEVVRDLRSAGQDAWPVPFPIYLLGHADTQGLLPLGGVSGVPTVLFNEVGSYVTYRSDERGFRNPPGMWSVDGLQLAAVGDSYTQGMCVKDHESAIDLIRVAYPRTLNLGMSGDGPLLELATLKEYLPELRPPRVLWFYFEGNDLVLDLDMERKSRSLTAYLKPGHRQNLLDPAVTQTGIAVAQDDKGRYFGVQMFGRPKTSAIRFSLRNRSAQSIQNRSSSRRSIRLLSRWMTASSGRSWRRLRGRFPGGAADSTSSICPARRATMTRRRGAESTPCGRRSCPSFET